MSTSISVHLRKEDQIELEASLLSGEREDGTWTVDLRQICESGREVWITIFCSKEQAEALVGKAAVRASGKKS
ncbi:MAG: hypothetical protein FJ275_08090 [Planctomycetes bacterium]|nr:hypothetical protein [Planctomycetota bacterium]